MAFRPSGGPFDRLQGRAEIPLFGFAQLEQLRFVLQRGDLAISPALDRQEIHSIIHSCRGDLPSRPVTNTLDTSSDLSRPQELAVRLEELQNLQTQAIVMISRSKGMTNEFIQYINNVIVAGAEANGILGQTLKTHIEGEEFEYVVSKENLVFPLLDELEATEWKFLDVIIANSFVRQLLPTVIERFDPRVWRHHPLIIILMKFLMGLGASYEEAEAVIDSLFESAGAFIAGLLEALEAGQWGRAMRLLRKIFTEIIKSRKFIDSLLKRLGKKVVGRLIAKLLARFAAIGGMIGIWITVLQLAAAILAQLSHSGAGDYS